MLKFYKVIGLFLGITFTSFSQTTKQIAYPVQTWLGYFNQTRLSNKWGISTDIHYRTKDNYVEGSYRFLVRLAAIHYVTDDFRLLAGYAFNNNYPEEGHLAVSQPEHRLWQQIQLNSKINKIKTTQALRLEERWLHKIKNDNELADGYKYATRLRYNYLLQIPLSKKGFAPKTLALVFNDEIFINLGQKVLYNTFDQNRLFAGLAYTFNPKTTLQVGYLNVYQQLGAGNKYRNTNATRIFLLHTFDLRKKKS